MKRFVTSISIAVLVLSLGLCENVAWSQANTDLNQAAVDGELEKVKTLVGEGADLSSKNMLGMTPLVVAAMNGHTAVCEFLLTKGSDVNSKDSRGQTALHHAVIKGNKELVEVLVKNKADINMNTSRGENAFSLAKKSGNAEIVGFLDKNGAKDPVVSNDYGDAYYGDDGAPPAGQRPGMPRAVPTRGMPPAAAEVDLLADPNKIKATVKSFEGLEKAIKVVGAKSFSEKRYWEQSKSDNRTLLARAVQKQIDEELALVRKIAVEEKAAKSTEAIDKMLKTKKDRDTKVRAALFQQRREAAAGISTRGGGRTRGSSRSSGRSSGRGYSSSSSRRGVSSSGYASDGGVDGGSYGMSDNSGGTGMIGRGRTGRSSAKPPEQLDPDTKAEIDLWTQATPDTNADAKLELAKSLHPLTYGDFVFIRKIAVEEKAKKTTAAIDGVLLARQERYDAYVKKAEAAKSALAPGQNPGQLGDPRLQQGVRGRSGRGSRGRTGDTQQQNMQSGGRRRR